MIDIRRYVCVPVVINNLVLFVISTHYHAYSLNVGLEINCLDVKTASPK